MLKWYSKTSVNFCAIRISNKVNISTRKRITKILPKESYCHSNWFLQCSNQQNVRQIKFHFINTWAVWCYFTRPKRPKIRLELLRKIKMQQLCGSNIVSGCQEYFLALLNLIAAWFSLRNVIQYCWQTRPYNLFASCFNLCIIKQLPTQDVLP